MAQARREPLQTIEWEVAHRPRCGLCSFYPLEQGVKWFCPIKEETVYRTNKPPKTRSRDELRHFLCFHPMTQVAWETLFRIRQRREVAGEKKRRRAHPEKHREEVRRYQRANPEIQRERNRRYREEHPVILQLYHRRWYQANRERAIEKARFRHYIDYYDPVWWVLKRFRYYRRQERTGHNLEPQVHVWRDFNEEREATQPPIREASNPPSPT